MEPQPGIEPAPAENRGVSAGSIALKLALGSLLSAGVVYFLFQRIDADRLVETVGKVTPGVLLLAAFVYWGSLFLRACRWKVLLGRNEEARVVPLFAAYLIGAGFNTLIPAKAGEVFRMQIASQWLQMSRLRLAGGVFIEKCQDMLVLLAFFAVGVYVVADQIADPALLTKIFYIAASLLAAALTGLVGLFFFYPRWLEKARDNRLLRFVDSFVSGISGAVTTRLGRNLILTVAIWAADLFTLWLILYSLQIDLQVLELMLLTGAYSFVSLVPSAPVHLGTYQAAFVFVFSILGHSAESAFVGALLVQACLLVPVAFFAVIAAFWFWRDMVRFRRS